MSKDPAVLFYTSDFLTGTFTFTDEQVGKYIRLLCLQHQKGVLTEKDMLNICKTYDKDIYSKFVENDGNYYNQRMFDEAKRRKEYSESRRNNRASTKDMNNICKTYDKHMETETETINEVSSLVVNKRKEQILEYCQEQGFPQSEGESFYDHYQALGWKTSAGMGIVDWKAKMRTWHKEQINREQKNGSKNTKPGRGSIDADKYKRLLSKEPVL